MYCVTSDLLFHLFHLLFTIFWVWMLEKFEIACVAIFNGSLCSRLLYLPALSERLHRPPLTSALPLCLWVKPREPLQPTFSGHPGHGCQSLGFTALDVPLSSHSHGAICLGGLPLFYLSCLPDLFYLPLPSKTNKQTTNRNKSKLWMNCPCHLRISELKHHLLRRAVGTCCILPDPAGLILGCVHLLGHFPLLSYNNSSQLTTWETQEAPYLPPTNTKDVLGWMNEMNRNVSVGNSQQ